MGVDVLSLMTDTARFRLNAGSGATGGQPETRRGQHGVRTSPLTAPWRNGGDKP